MFSMSPDEAGGYEVATAPLAPPTRWLWWSTMAARGLAAAGAALGAALCSVAGRRAAAAFLDGAADVGHWLLSLTGLYTDPLSAHEYEDAYRDIAHWITLMQRAGHCNVPTQDTQTGTVMSTITPFRLWLWHGLLPTVICQVVSDKRARLFVYAPRKLDSVTDLIGDVQHPPRYGTVNYICELRPTAPLYLPEETENRVFDSVASFLAGTGRRLGVLAHGPPGTGKTSLARAVALKFNLDVYTGSSNAAMRTYSLRPCLVLIDEVDQLIAKPHELAAMLATLEDVNAPRRCVYWLTTNYRARLPPALLRAGRVDCELELGPLAAPEARRMIRSDGDAMHATELEKLIEAGTPLIPCAMEVAMAAGGPITPSLEQAAKLYEQWRADAAASA